MKEKSQLTNLQTEIQTRYDSLSKRLKQVAKYILDNSDSIVFDTVAVIAEKADVPPSTLIRFASEFGFSGFNEMKQIFRVISGLFHKILTEDLFHFVKTGKAEFRSKTNKR